MTQESKKMTISVITDDCPGHCGCCCGAECEAVPVMVTIEKKCPCEVVHYYYPVNGIRIQYRIRRSPLKCLEDWIREEPYFGDSLGSISKATLKWTLFLLLIVILFAGVPIAAFIGCLLLIGAAGWLGWLGTLAIVFCTIVWEIKITKWFKKN